MSKAEILVVGQNETLLQLLNATDQWRSMAAHNSEEAVEKFHQYVFDVVVLTGSITSAEERMLRTLFLHQHPGVIILSYNDENHELFRQALREALERRHEQNKPSVSFIDDALQNAGFRITIQ